jgi:hypothetical protein
MNFTHFITNHGKRINREHFLHLVQVAKTDGVIAKPELELLHKEGMKFGLTDPEIEQLINSEDFSNYHPPYSLRDKFEELYNIAQMVLADEVVTDSEERMLRRYAIAVGLRDNIIEGLIDILFKGVAKGADEEHLFKEFKKKYF